MSKEFAKATALTFAANDIEKFNYLKIKNPTPEAFIYC